MDRKFFKYVPLTRLVSGSEFVNEFVFDRCGISPDDLTLHEILEDSNTGWRYVILESEKSELLSAVMDAVNGRFSAVELKELEFLGECCWLYNPVSLNGETPPTFSEFVGGYGLSYDNISDLDLKKIGRVSVLKDITKRKFDKWNDVTADITKIITLLFGHYDDLTDEQKQTVDSTVARVKAIYNTDMCIEAFVNMVHNLEANLAPYYEKKLAIIAAQSDEELKNIELS